MAVIGFSDKVEHNWIFARWVYRQVLEDVISHCPNDTEMVEMLTEKINTDGLLTEFLEPALAARVANAIKQVTSGILSGAIRSGIHDKSHGDAHRVKGYRNALQELLKAIPSPEELKTA
jgi:hypothetical protein